MDTKIAAVAGPIDPSLVQVTSTPAATSGDARGARGPDQVETRLVIEEDHGLYVYKTINRLTGEVVLQLPRDEVLKMREAADYAAGKMVDTKA
jgi:flagellar protein FlaG